MICSNSNAEEVSYDAHGHRDPFTPLVSMTSRSASGLVGVDAADELKVEGIVFDPEGSIAIVNGSVMKEGDELGNVKLIQIRKDGALFTINGIEAFKSLYQEKENQ